MNSRYAERAKIFCPFDALKGFREALAERERVIVPKIELSEEGKEELDRKFQNIAKNDMITVIFFHQGEYLKISGMISSLDVTSRILRVVNTRIPFDDILDIQLEAQNQSTYHESFD